MDWSDFGNWGAAQWSAAISALGAFATLAATVYAAKAARAAERSIDAQFRPQIVLWFEERDGGIFLRMLNAGGPAQRIHLEADPPLANSLNHLLTDQQGLQGGYPILLPQASAEFVFDNYWDYFGLRYIFYGRPLDFQVVVRCWAATLEREWVTTQVLTLRPLVPRTPKGHRGMDYANAQLQQWQSEGPSSSDLEQLKELETEIEAYANRDGVGYLSPNTFTNMEQLLQHIGWTRDASYQGNRLLMAEKQRGAMQGERIFAAGWEPRIAMIRLVHFAMRVNEEEKGSTLNPSTDAEGQSNAEKPATLSSEHDNPPL